MSLENYCSKVLFKYVILLGEIQYLGAPFVAQSSCLWSVYWRPTRAQPVLRSQGTRWFAMKSNAAARQAETPNSSRPVWALWCTRRWWTRSREPVAAACARALSCARRRQSILAPIPKLHIYSILCHIQVFKMFTWNANPQAKFTLFIRVKSVAMKRATTLRFSRDWCPAKIGRLMIGTFAKKEKSASGNPSRMIFQCGLK